MSTNEALNVVVDILTDYGYEVNDTELLNYIKDMEDATFNTLAEAIQFQDEDFIARMFNGFYR